LSPPADFSNNRKFEQSGVLTMAARAYV